MIDEALTWFFYKINFKSQIFKKKLTFKKKINMNKGLLIIFFIYQKKKIKSQNLINWIQIRGFFMHFLVETGMGD